MKHGRCAYENVQKYTQLELTMTIVGLSISFITTSSYGDSDCGNTRGIALLREPPAKKLMRKQPVGHSGTLITKAMWRNIIAQASYQVGILVSIQCNGAAILGTNLEAVFIEIEHIVGGSERLNGGQWGICFLIGMAPWVIDWATKMGIRFHHRLDWTQSAI
ncbi:putative calcium-transporting ATPase 13, plasma membrane-type [Vitis vinifera]|uniref:Putative calcium-transporting ATPase 13, plasma membrane-type n=1 Tax=Vitis vinifera TaxID=29760 RepID=A0A438DDQ0_VITVI|nr:putative calcium-transporting ATPase 13, plasma membrane-type [Vitis vinifera]